MEEPEDPAISRTVNGGNRRSSRFPGQWLYASLWMEEPGEPNSFPGQWLYASLWMEESENQALIDSG